MQNKLPIKIDKNDNSALVVTLRVKKNIVKLIDKERGKFSSPRSSWITQAIVEKLEKLGYNVN